MLSAALTNRFDDDYHYGLKSSLSHACAVLSYSDFVFDWSGHAISNLVMFLMVCVRFLRMLGDVAIASFSPERQWRRYPVH